MVEYPSPAFSLQRKFQCELNLTWIASRRQKSELRGTKGCSVDRILRPGFSELHVGMIEHVEEFSTEFKFCPLGNRKILEQREVPYLIARPLDAIPANVTERPQSGLSESASVKER